MAASLEQRATWIRELEQQMEAQAVDSWTIAKMRLVYPSEPKHGGLLTVDNVSAAGSCSAQAVQAQWNEAVGRAEVAATFGKFELRGTSPILGQFSIKLQDGARAEGLFRQRYADRLWPLHGSWRVPFLIETRLGKLIPRPSDEPVVLRSADPGEFAIPPLGSWFEKWDPIHLVGVDDPEGATLAICEHALHCMLNVGSEPATPPFYWR